MHGPTYFYFVNILRYDSHFQELLDIEFIICSGELSYQVLLQDLLAKMASPTTLDNKKPEKEKKKLERESNHDFNPPPSRE